MVTRSFLAGLASAIMLVSAGCVHRTPAFDAETATVATLRADLASGSVAAEDVVATYLDRIAALDDAGPTLNAVLAINPNALADARALDAARAAGETPGPLFGVPILIKDNIETADPMATTAGSLALANNVTGRDAPAVARLRAADAVILGKANLSEWANIRSTNSVSGWSAVEGFTRNPYALDRNPCGSSAGSAAAVAAGLAAAAIGTETNGSIVCPAAVNGVVGMKPTVGLVSRRYIVPISDVQDTAGPITRSVADAAALLTVMAGSDPDDPATAEADARKEDYAAALDSDALAGARIGVARFLMGYHAETDARVEEALDAMRAAGAEIVAIENGPDMGALNAAAFTAVVAEFKASVNAYLADAAPKVETRTLADLIRFNEDTPEELAWFGQELFEQAQATTGLDDPAYIAARAQAARLAGPQGLDRILAEHALDAIVAPTVAPAWPTDIVLGARYLGGASTLPAAAGYPHVTVPMGAVRGLPVGLSFIGPAWSDAQLLGLAFAYEQATHARTPPHYVEHSGLGVAP